MLLSKSQSQRFWREWSAACRYQGWKETLSADEIDAKRKELLARCGFKSLTLVDKTSGFDRVLAELRALQDDLQRTVETEDPTIGAARRFRAVILQEIIPCLALYEDDANVYLTTVISGLVRWNKTDRPERDPTLEDLDAKPTFKKSASGQWREGPSKLEQAMMTLNARLHTKRRDAGDTIHDMKLRAGVACDCKICSQPHLVEELAPDLEHQPF